jgi:hypothetical protein
MRREDTMRVMKLRSVLRGARAVLLSLNAQRVSLETVQNRVETCAGCFPWLDPQGTLLSRWVSRCYEWVFPSYADFEPYRSRANWRCNLCSCSIRMKARLDVGFIHAHTDPELSARAPAWCWWRKPLDATPEQAQQ